MAANLVIFSEIEPYRAFLLSGRRAPGSFGEFRGRENEAVIVGRLFALIAPRSPVASRKGAVGDYAFGSALIAVAPAPFGYAGYTLAGVGVVGKQSGHRRLRACSSARFNVAEFFESFGHSPRIFAVSHEKIIAVVVGL